MTGRTLSVLVGLSVLTLSFACSIPTEGVPMTVKIQEQQLEADELALWPTTPEINGGFELTVRGIMYFGCETPIAYAALNGSVVTVRVSRRSGDPDRCRAITTGWHGYELTLPGLPDGWYDVVVREDGKPGQYRERVRIS
ncbi:MAG: hypothetical protein U0132_22015 [Gemmatimonadaceae bacterium]